MGELWQVGDAFPDTLWGPEAQGARAFCLLFFIAYHIIRHVCKGTRPAPWGLGKAAFLGGLGEWFPARCHRPQRKGPSFHSRG